MEPGNEEFYWRDHASCVTVIEPFFIEGFGPVYSKARDFCSECPVVIDCLIEALDSSDGLGFWGCMSPNERAEVALEMKRGTPMKVVTERIWGRHRRRRRGAKVPPPTVWREWIT